MYASKKHIWIEKSAELQGTDKRPKLALGSLPTSGSIRTSTPMCRLVHEAYDANYLIWLRMEGRTHSILTWATTVWISSAPQGTMPKTGRCDVRMGTHDTPIGQKVTSQFLQLPLHAPSTSPSSFNESNELAIHISDTAEHITSAGRKLVLGGSIFSYLRQYVAPYDKAQTVANSILRTQTYPQAPTSAFESLSVPFSKSRNAIFM